MRHEYRQESRKASSLMILPIVSSLVFSNKRRTVIEIFPPSLRKLWKEWDLRLMVVLSLVLQIILIILGHCRKYKQSLLIRAVVWSIYLAADSTAIFALGILSNNLTDIYYDEPRSRDANTELTAFWAPFLLLHLGGPDTITAYSLEDNELWPRHFIGLVVQTVITVYVFLLSCAGSWLSILFLLMFFTGFLKYGERNYTLRSASNEKLRESLFTPSQFGPYNDLLRRDNLFKYEEGYMARVDAVPDYQLSVDLSVFTSNKPLSTRDKLLTTSEVLGVTKCLFSNIFLSYRERDRTKSVFRNMSSEDAFEVVETELGLIYDLLYTKAPVICKPWGLALRGISFSVICYVLVSFTAFLGHKNRYSKIDVIITYLLLIGAVIVDVYSAFLLLISDQFHIWLCTKHKRAYNILQSLTCFPQSKKRWSDQMPQWSLLRHFISEKPLPCLIIRRIPKIGKMLEKQQHAAFKVPSGIKALIFRCIKEFVCKDVEGSTYELKKTYFRVLPAARGKKRGKTRGEALNRYLTATQIPRLDDELGNSIFFWHIVTEVSYNLDTKQFEGIFEQCRLVKHISRYMGYLLVKYPSLLSLGAEKIALHKTIDKAIDELRRAAKEVRKEVNSQNSSEAWEKLVKFFEPVEESSGSSSNKLFYDALKFADSIRDEEDLTEKWNKFASVWLQMLFIAAKRSSGMVHAEHLRRGGEFITHVWLLMAHFGLTPHFKITDQNIEKVVAK